MSRRTRIKIKTPSKAKIRREMRRAVTKNLKCPNCGRNMPTTSMSQSKCPGCGFTLKL